MAKSRVSFVTNICDHYSVRLFEILSKRFDVMFYFTGAGEHYRKAKARSVLGNFPFKKLEGIYIFPRFRITPGIMGLLSKEQEYSIT